jgi:hypothetical protein
LGWLKLRTYGRVLRLNSFCALLFAFFLGWVQFRRIARDNIKRGRELFRAGVGGVSSLFIEVKTFT